MPKANLSFNPAEYALVADRITLFYERYPTGRITTKLLHRDRDVVVQAAVYRTVEDRRPAATGLASEREGDGEINLVACLENTETSAIGRALANLGFTASRKRPSREEMEKAERTRWRAMRVAESGGEKSAPTETPVVALKEPATPPQSDLAKLLEEAVEHRFPADRAAEIGRLIGPLGANAEIQIERMEVQLRRWIREHPL